MLLRKAQLESKDEISFKVTSGLIFSIYNNLKPEVLAGIVGPMTNTRARSFFFYLSQSRIVKFSLSILY